MKFARAKRRKSSQNLKCKKQQNRSAESDDELNEYIDDTESGNADEFEADCDQVSGTVVQARI